MSTTKYIIGADINGLIARDILGSDWKIIPYSPNSPSEFFSKHLLIEDFIEFNSELDDYLRNFGNINRVDFFADAFSLGGSLMKNDFYWKQYYERIYDNMSTVNHMARLSKIGRTYYKGIKISNIYENLLNKYKNEFMDHKIVKIMDHKIICADAIFEYDKIICVIPLNILFKLIDKEYDLIANDVTIAKANFKHNLEGNEIIYVVDDIPFHKVIKHSRYYSLFFIGHVEKIPILLEDILEELNIYDVYHIKNFYTEFNLHEKIDDIYLLGQYARWDDGFTIGTAVLNLLKGEFD